MSRKEKQRLISHYIDYLEIEKVEKYRIKKLELLSSFLNEQLQNHDNYNTPYVFSLLQDEHGNDFLLNKEVRTSTKAFNYYEKLKDFISHYNDCKLGYKEMIFSPQNGGQIKSLTTEIIIKAILIDDKKLLKEDKLRFGLITLDLDNVKEFTTKNI